MTLVTHRSVRLKQENPSSKNWFLESPFKIKDQQQLDKTMPERNETSQVSSLVEAHRPDI